MRFLDKLEISAYCHQRTTSCRFIVAGSRAAVPERGPWPISAGNGVPSPWAGSVPTHDLSGRVRTW